MGKRGKRKFKKALTVVLTGLLVFLFITLGTGYFWWQQIYSADNRDYNLPEVNHGHKEGEEEKRELDKDRPTIIMVLGLDQRRNEPARADTIMLFSMHWETQQLSVISIPRDTRVHIPGRGTEKINHAYAYGEVSLTQKALEDFLDIEVDRYIVTNLAGFENLVDILGGVEMEVEKRMQYYASDVTIDLYPGVQRLDGDKALQYVRFRADAAGDLGRMERQQKFVKAFIDEAYQMKTIWKLPQLLGELTNHLRTNMDLGEMREFTKRIQNSEVEEIKTATLPGTTDTIGGVSYFIADEWEKDRLVREYILWENNGNN
ncbi:MAG: LytR family transcriptional regulator [Candidatus Syntrophonatronum acetioxidans]|uniref:LytR family transcriptional regulator n=1 Tax=Candidatus Syntrophonatronum acetioxidans TaxID=1795816 RepID=A0A424YBG8_9FIRM|nr:MAG: LytR family transcriptional regulator [Candidatus Syntrophonatronum acetioxidans]